MIIVNFIEKYILNIKISTGCLLTIHKNKLCNDEINKPFYSIPYMLNMKIKYKIILIILIISINIIKIQLV
jgi:hypothetical protein